MGFFRAIGRFFMAIVHLFTGKTNRASERLEEDPDAAKAKYMEEIRKLETAKAEAVRALAITTAQVNQMKTKLASQEAKNEETEKNLETTKAKIKAHAAGLQGKGLSKEQIQADETYKKLMKFFAKFKAQDETEDSEREHLAAQIDEISSKLENDTERVREFDKAIQTHKAEANKMYSELKMGMAEDKLDDAMGAMDGTANADSAIADLQAMRERVNANRSIKRKVSGREESDEEAAFLKDLHGDKATASLEDELGLFDDEPAKTETATATKDTLPE